MSLVELSGIPVVSGTITLNRSGRCGAALELEDTPPREGARVDLRGPGLALAGCVTRVGTFQDRYRVQVYGGTDGLTKPIPAQSFRSMPVSLLLDDMLGAVGERRSLSIEADLLARVLPAWVRPAGLCSDALRSLCKALGVGWRVTLEGSIWIGIDTWRASPATGELLDADPITRTIHAALDDMRLEPGTTWQGCKVESVTHTITSTGFRSDVRTLRPEASKPYEGDFIRTAILGLTRHTDYYAQRAAKVIAQNEDYTLELKPEDEAWPGMSKVPIRYGLPGVRYRVKAGARVLFTFEDGDSTRPIVVDCDGAVEKIIFAAGIVDLRDEKGRAIACNGDMVMVPSTKPIPVQLFLEAAGTTPAIVPVMSGPTVVGTATFPPMFLRFMTPGFMAVGQVIAVSPNKS